jgi:hypothetical protein
MGSRCAAGKKESSFCEQKEAKKLYPFARGQAVRKRMKSFLVLFFKKEPLAYLPRNARRT